MPQIPNQNPEHKEEYLGYTLRYLNDPNGTWKFIVPEEQFRHPETKKVYHIRRGERAKAHELFAHIASTMIALDRSAVHEIHLVYGGDLKAENKVVDGGQVMKKCFRVNGEPKVYDIWDPFPPPPKLDIPEPDAISFGNVGEAVEAAKELVGESTGDVVVSVQEAVVVEDKPKQSRKKKEKTA